MAYSQINQAALQSGVNPADRNNMAIQAGYTGWDDYQNNAKSTQPTASYNYGGSSVAPGGGGASWEDTVKKAIEMQKAANAPAVASYQAQIPEIQSQYAAQTANVNAKSQTLKDRYDALLKSIDTQKTKDVSAQTVVTQNELGKRGLLPSSTLAQQEMINATTPITDKYTGLSTTAALDQTSGQQDLQSLLNQLTSGQTSDTRNVMNAIAQLESGASSSGMQLGSQIYGSEQSRLAQQAAAEAQARQDAIANQIAQAQLANQTAKTQYDINAPYFKPGTGEADTVIDNGTGTGTGTGLQWLNSQGTKWTDKTKIPTIQFKGKDGKMYQEYSDGTYGPTLWNKG